MIGTKRELCGKIQNGIFLIACSKQRSLSHCGGRKFDL